MIAISAGESAAMREDYTTPEHRTRILPLRILANHVFHPISYWFFQIALKYNDRIEWDKDYKWHHRAMEYFGFRLYKLFDYPYMWWGTLYKVDMDKLKASLEDMDLSGEEWDDYDADGIPYWEKWEEPLMIEDQWDDFDETEGWDFVDSNGDAFRIINK